MYQLAERLLQLGADAHVARGWMPMRAHETHQSVLVDSIMLLLKYGLDPCCSTLMHALVAHQRLDVLQRLYGAAPSSMVDVNFCIPPFESRLTVMECAEARLRDAETDEQRQRAREIVTLLEKERKKLMDLDHILQQYKENDTHTTDNNNNGTNNSNSVNNHAATTARRDNTNVDTMMEEEEEEEEEEERKQADDVPLNIGMHLVDESDVVISDAHDQYEFDLERRHRLHRRTFTMRLLRNMWRWIAFDETEAYMECIGRVALMFIEKCQMPVHQSLIDLNQTDDGGRDVVQIFCEQYGRSQLCAETQDNDAVVAIIN